MDASHIITALKTQLIKDIINDEEIVEAIDSPYKNDKNWNPTYLKDSYGTRQTKFSPHIYTYNKFPETIEDAITFILVLVQIPRCFTDLSKVEPRIEFWIYSHKEHIYMENKQIPINRNDYIAELLIKKFNKHDEKFPYDFGFSYSDEGAYDKVHLFRKVEFSCKAFNKSICDINESEENNED